MRILVIFLFLLLFSACTKKSITFSSGQYPDKYRFSTDWFSYNIPIWEKHLNLFKNIPNLSYLEVGVFEGRSFLWMLENIITHTSSKAVAIDIFRTQKLEKTFRDNIEKSGFSSRVSIIKGWSQDVLKKLTTRFDIIYIDASHFPQDVNFDAALCWHLLKQNGLLIFDDYLWREKQLPINLRPQVAIDDFVFFNSNNLNILHKGKQVIIKKVSPHCNMPHSKARWQSRMGNFCAYWERTKNKKQYNIVIHSDDGTIIRLTEKMKQKLLKIFWADRDKNEFNKIFYKTPRQLQKILD